MKLVNAEIGIDIDFIEGKAVSIVVENVDAFREIISGISQQVEGALGDFVLSDAKKLLKMNKAISLVVNPFAVSLNDRKIVSNLYSNLTDIGNECVLEKTTARSSMLEFIDLIVSKEQYSNIEYDFEFKWDDFFKLFHVRIGEEYPTLLEKYIEYIKVVASLTEIRVIIFVGIKNYLHKDELNELCKQATYSKIQLIFIENNKQVTLDNEVCYIIDKDNCLITP